MRIKYLKKSVQRIDKFLIEQNIEKLYSRSFIDRLTSEEKIKVNNKPIKKSHLLKEGDIIDISIPRKESLEIEPENIPLDFIWQDKYMAIINKPAGVVVHPGA
ncbi:MAG: RluA family pseudouridine synthase, partial [Candidatus Cloacimonetes bacterium]|nr:RluA family pseudouridine synthase [Candidatus Cloacimonadota bacterium]